MVEWAFNPPIALLFPLRVRAGLRLIKQWVVLLLLPPMAVRTARLLLASLMILSYERPRLPIGAELSFVRELTWFTSKVLVIMSVHALCLVVIVVKWAPFSFEVEHIEICISLHMMNKAHFKLLRVVSERTVISVLTSMEVLRILGAVLGLIFGGVIH